MPLIKSAIKKMRSDLKKRAVNQAHFSAIRTFVAKALVETTPSSVSQAISALDKAAKKGIIHKNKASRKKASLMKLLTSKPMPVKKISKSKKVKK